MGAIIDKLKEQRAHAGELTKPEFKCVDIPEGLFIACEKCNAAIFQKKLDENLRVCPHCQHHFRLTAWQRIRFTVDDESFYEHSANLQSSNPLDMPDYDEKIAKSQKLTNNLEAFVAGVGTIGQIKVALGVLDPFFMMGSMGSVVGEKLTRLIEHALAERLPLIVFSASGGARMQEGIFSLMQMAKTAAALKRYSDAGLLYISVLTDPTTGGVAASFSSLGDILIAEHGALIGFAGARVIKQTIQQDLPEGFQTANFQLHHGQVDLVLKRAQMRSTIALLLRLHRTESIK